MKKRIENIDLIIFAIPIVFWGFSLCIFAPGILTYDSYNQLTQIATGIFTDTHPIIRTLIELLCLKIYNSPASIAIFQILYFSIIWTIICKYNRKSDSKKIKIFEIVLTIIISINPMNAIMSITLWKDVLYSYTFLLLCFILEIFLDKNLKVNFNDLLFVSFVLTFLPNLRHNGTIILAGILLLLLVLLFKKDKESKNYLKLLMLVSVFFVAFKIPVKLLSKDTTSISYKAGNIVDYKELQMLGVYLSEGILSNDDKAILQKYISLDKLNKYASPFFLDDVVLNCDINEKYMLSHQSELLNLTTSVSLKYPYEFIKYEIKSNSIIFAYYPLKGTIGTIITTDINSSNKFDYINPINKDTVIYNKATNIVNKIYNIKILEILLYSPGFYLTLGFIAYLYLIIKVKKIYYVLGIPNILNILGLLISLPVQDARYVYPNFMIFYLFLIIIVSNLVVRRKGEKKYAKSKQK